jgi:hypothetical protein
VLSTEMSLSANLQNISNWRTNMPYIPKEDRVKIDAALSLVGIYNPGDLNYAITRLVHNYIDSFVRKGGGYSMLNEIVGVLECAKQEFYRTVVAPYEEKKRLENGDI